MTIGAVEADLISPAVVTAASFDGIDDTIAITLANVSGIPDPNSQSMSITCWYKPESQADQTMINYNYAGSMNLSIGYDNTGTLKTGATGATSRSGSVVVSEWHSVVLSYDKASNTLTSYADGVVLSGTSGPNNSAGVGILRFGERHITASPAKGLLRNVCLYNVALTAAEALSHAGGTRTPRGLVAYWPLNGNANEGMTGLMNGVVTGAVFKQDADDISDTIAANRAGATDKYLLSVVAGAAGPVLLTATIQET